MMSRYPVSLFIHTILPLAFFASQAWQNVFSKNAVFDRAHLAFKCIHSLALIYIASICWDSLMLATYIAANPAEWLKNLTQAQRPYPVWIDVSFQPAESVIGIFGLFCCYKVLRGSERARRRFVVLLPAIFICFTYHVLKAALERQKLQAFYLATCGVAAVFAVILLFYASKTVRKIFLEKNSASVPNR
ncbi:MAG TPA: hypothetical protein VFW05_19860 [Verrucomicrobiae bacterium]|nr:hypothetical protein [Verrucomicrobiae bacterium]